jgi:hypothetical protein
VQSRPEDARHLVGLIEAPKAATVAVSEDMSRASFGGSLVHGGQRGGRDRDAPQRRDRDRPRTVRSGRSPNIVGDAASVPELTPLTTATRSRESQTATFNPRAVRGEQEMAITCT